MSEKEDLPLLPYLAAAKVWGKCVEEIRETGPTHVWAWQSCIAALRAYEDERIRSSGHGQNPDCCPQYPAVKT
jgi:hypothetical protein